MDEVIHYLRESVRRGDGGGSTDGQLLGYFVERRDQAAFAALVRRHGPMVWGVCRRLLDPHDAEDAFQATFLVLVRKAASIVPLERVGNWLYGVAHQTALQARRNATRRRAREKQVAEMPEPAAAEEDHGLEIRPRLDQELSRLPGAYRDVIVLCDLGGKTRGEAARELGLPEGTVASRLARGREMLARRLGGHGLTTSPGASPTVLWQQSAWAYVPPAVVSSTTRTAALVAAGQAASTGPAQVKVIALTEGVLRAMFLAKVKAAAAVALIFVSLGGAGLAYQSQAARDTSGKGGQWQAAHAAGEQDPAKGAEPAKKQHRVKGPEQGRAGELGRLAAGELDLTARELDRLRELQREIDARIEKAQLQSRIAELEKQLRSLARDVKALQKKLDGAPRQAPGVLPANTPGKSADTPPREPKSASSK